MNSNILKLIACFSMLIDHIGYFLLPNILIFRILGRLAFPIFAFFIAEGCKYTHSKIKYLLRVFILALICQLGEFIDFFILKSSKDIFLNVLFTFTFSIILCILYYKIKEAANNENTKGIIIYSIITFLFLFFLYFICFVINNIISINISVDYSFCGILLPLFALVVDNKKYKLLSFSLGIVILCISLMNVMPYIFVSLLSIPLLYFYNGERGKAKLKWFFYLFYPVHILIIYGISYSI